MGQRQLRQLSRGHELDPSGVPGSRATLNFSNASITPVSTITFGSDATAGRTDFRVVEFVIQTGANTWNLTNGWQIGSAGVTSQSNRVTIDGGTVNSSFYTCLGSAANDRNNSLLLTKGATVNFGSINNRIGGAGNTNQVSVGGGSVLTSGAGGLNIGVGSSATANTLLVSGANSVFSSGATVIVGSGVSAHGTSRTVLLAETKNKSAGGPYFVAPARWDAASYVQHVPKARFGNSAHALFCYGTVRLMPLTNSNAGDPGMADESWWRVRKN